MEKIKFEKPEISIVLINSEDIITTSGTPTETTFFGASLWTPWDYV